MEENSRKTDSGLAFILRYIESNRINRDNLNADNTRPTSISDLPIKREPEDAAAAAEPEERLDRAAPAASLATPRGDESTAIANLAATAATKDHRSNKRKREMIPVHGRSRPCHRELQQQRQRQARPDGKEITIDRSERTCVPRVGQGDTQGLDFVQRAWEGIHEANWMKQYKRLVEYKAVHGNTNVPSGWDEDPSLGHWVKYQRSSCRDKNRRDLLNMIGFDWGIKHEESWKKMYDRLVAYKGRYGTTCVSHKWGIDPQLATWVDYQRRHCKIKDRIDLLNDIGFVWPSRKPNSWMTMYRRLLAYKKKYGHISVPRKWKEDPELGSWAYSQRYCKNKDRRGLLKKIGFVFSRQIELADGQINLPSIDPSRQFFGHGTYPI